MNAAGFDLLEHGKRGITAYAARDPQGLQAMMTVSKKEQKENSRGPVLLIGPGAASPGLDQSQAASQMADTQSSQQNSSSSGPPMKARDEYSPYVTRWCKILYGYG